MDDLSLRVGRSPAEVRVLELDAYHNWLYKTAAEMLPKGWKDPDLDDLVQEGPDGFSIIPPDTGSNTQRIFVPRAALAEMTVLAVIGERKTRRRGQRPDDTRQVPMFT